MNVYHETQFSSASPMVDGGSGDVYWINGLDLWRRGPLAQDRPAWVNRFPADVANGRPPERVETHLTRSADGKCVGIDARFGGETYIGEMPLDGSPVSIWETSTSFYDHAQFSPTDPDVQMVALEYWQDHVHDAFDGRLPYNRLWTIKRGGRLDPVLNEPVSHSGHEWWDTDGKHIWYVHYGVGIKKVDLATRAETLLWPGHLAHGYSDAAGVFLVADMMADTVVCDCHVAFFNTTTGNAIDIVNTAPLPADVTQCTHLHPHPRFCLRDRYICHTTTVYGRVDMALVPTGPLIERTS